MKNKFIIKLGDFITKFRNVFLVLFACLSLFFAFKIDDVKINNSIVDYLPDGTETKTGIEIMDKEFGKLTSISVMVNDISLEKSKELFVKISSLEGIDNVIFNEDSYKDSKALYTINLTDKSKEELTDIESSIKDVLNDLNYDMYSEGLIDPTDGVNLVLLLVGIIIIVILFVTCKSYFVPILAIMTFVISIVLNMGTNYLLGEISYITESIAVVLQLALSIDYVIIFINQYMKEIKDNDKLLAIKKTTSKAIPEIFASSLTTISGLLALIFMQLRIGGDIGVVLSKGILFSLLTVILVMPSLLYMFNDLIIKFKRKEKTKKDLKISNFIVNKKKPLLIVFLVGILLSCILIPNYKYVYNLNSVKAINKNESTIALENIENTFGSDNTIVILVKNEKDYAKELDLANKLKENSKISSITSIGNYAINKDLKLGQPLNYLEVSKLFNIPVEQSLGLYQMIINKSNLKVDINQFKLPVVDLIYTLHDLELPPELSLKIDGMYKLIDNNIQLLESENYSRMILTVDVPVEGSETKELINEIRNITNDYYDDVTLVGNSINAIDLESSFIKDNTKITFITILFISIILLFTFKSIPMTLLLILTIEGSILMNFGFMTLINKPIFFMTYVVVSAIQMGATIDYAIVLASRYKQLRNKNDKEKSLIGSLNDSLPTIITSGLILLIAGIIVGLVSTSSVISSIGVFLSVGTFISLLCTIFILPALLYLFDRFIIKKNN